MLASQGLKWWFTALTLSKEGSKTGMDRMSRNSSSKRLKNQGVSGNGRLEYGRCWRWREMSKFLCDDSLWRGLGKENCWASSWVLYVRTTGLLRGPRPWKGFGKEAWLLNALRESEEMTGLSVGDVGRGTEVDIF